MYIFHNQSQSGSRSLAASPRPSSAYVHTNVQCPREKRLFCKHVTYDGGGNYIRLFYFRLSANHILSIYSLWMLIIASQLAYIWQRQHVKTHKAFTRMYRELILQFFFSQESHTREGIKAHAIQLSFDWIFFFNYLSILSLFLRANTHQKAVKVRKLLGKTVNINGKKSQLTWGASPMLADDNLDLSTSFNPLIDAMWSNSSRFCCMSCWILAYVISSSHFVRRGERKIYWV